MHAWMLTEWSLAIQRNRSGAEGPRFPGISPRAWVQGPALPSSASGLTAARNLILTGKRLQVLAQRLLLGETDDARDLPACSPAHGAL